MSETKKMDSNVFSPFPLFFLFYVKDSSSRIDLRFQACTPYYKRNLGKRIRTPIYKCVCVYIYVCKAGRLAQSETALVLANIKKKIYALLPICNTHAYILGILFSCFLPVFNPEGFFTSRSCIEINDDIR